MDLEINLRVEYDDTGTHYYINDQEVDSAVFNREIEKRFVVRRIREVFNVIFEE